MFIGNLVYIKLKDPLSLLINNLIFTSYWLRHVPGYHNILGNFLSFVVTFVSQFEANPLFKLKLCP